MSNQIPRRLLDNPATEATTRRLFGPSSVTTEGGGLDLVDLSGEALQASSAEPRKELLEGHGWSASMADHGQEDVEELIGCRAKQTDEVVVRVLDGYAKAFERLSREVGDVGGQEDRGRNRYSSRSVQVVISVFTGHVVHQVFVARPVDLPIREHRSYLIGNRSSRIGRPRDVADPHPHQLVEQVVSPHHPVEVLLIAAKDQVQKRNGVTDVRIGQHPNESIRHGQYDRPACSAASMIEAIPSLFASLVDLWSNTARTGIFR